MPLTGIPNRREAHRRIIDLITFDRGNGLYDAEAHLVDRKPFDFTRTGAAEPVRAGEPIHDLWVRITVDSDFVVRAIEAASDVTPWAVCKEAEVTLQVLVGETLGKGWNSRIRERLRGAASCTHLAELLTPLATAAFQGIYGLRSQQERSAGIGALVDTCHAFDRTRDVVKRLAPLHYRPREAGTS